MVAAVGGWAAGPGAGVAGSCNNNVVCPISAGWWPFPVQAVGAYTRSGIYFCSGTRLNNPAPRKEYFLTADHCGITAGNAALAVAAGADMLAVIGSLFEAGDVTGAARRLSQQFQPEARHHARSQPTAL